MPVEGQKKLDRLSKKILLFRILGNEPTLNAHELRAKAKENGVELTQVSAYRALRSFRENASIEDSEVRCLRLVSSILQNAPGGAQLSAMSIKQIADGNGERLHKSTIYRVLERLYSNDFVLMFYRSGQKYYEWKRANKHHGHLLCIKCGVDVEFGQDNLDAIAQAVCERTGFEFGHIEFLLRSFCPECRLPKSESAPAD